MWRWGWLTLGVACCAISSCDGDSDRGASPGSDAGRVHDGGAGMDAGRRRDASAGAAAGRGGTAAPHLDAAAEDAASGDAAGMDAAAEDAAASVMDGAVAIDAALADAAVDAAADAALDAAADAWVDSGSTPDAGCTPFVMPDDCAPVSGTALPDELRCTGLYGDFAARAIACGVLDFAPAFELWSDGAEKHRYVALPTGAQVDVSDPDAFEFPVGTQFWKEFRVRQGDSGPFQLGETRLLRKLATGWAATTYVWSADGSTALAQNNGVADLHGTGHRVPTRNQCFECHWGREDFILGWDRVMLGPGASGSVLEALPELAGAAVPGDAIERAALGYLHANCGVSCHNETLDAAARDSGLHLRLEADSLASVADTAAFKTGINKVPSAGAPIQDLPPPPGGLSFYDLLPGSPERSLALARMRVRQSAAQMPRIATERVDPAGIALVEAWIEHMVELPGYPPPAP